MLSFNDARDKIDEMLNLKAMAEERGGGEALEYAAHLTRLITEYTKELSRAVEREGK